MNRIRWLDKLIDKTKISGKSRYLKSVLGGNDMKTKKQISNRILSLVLSIMMVVSMLPTTVFAAETHTLNGQLTINSSNVSDYDGDIITGTLNDQLTTEYRSSVIVIDGVKVNLTFQDLSITDTSYSGYPVIQIKNGGRLNLTLLGTNYIKANHGGAGIEVTQGNTLHVKADSTGSLTTIGGAGYGGGAGIGASSNKWAIGYENLIQTQSVGSIIIDGGTITARGGSFWQNGFYYSGAAGIGGSSDSTTGTIVINGGTVNATGGFASAGLGGGYCGCVETITINGGAVTATAGSYGSAVGTGANDRIEYTLSCGDISIQGGTVEATGNIGYAIANHSNYSGGTVTIGDNARIQITNGEIDPNNSNIQKYTVNITLYDARLMNDTDVEVSILCDGKSLCQQTTSLSVADFKGTGNVSVYKARSYLDKDIEVTITAGDISWTANTTLNDTTNVEIGGSLNPVILEFVSPKMNADISDYQLSVLNTDGTALEDSEVSYIAGIKYVSDGKGQLQLYLREGTYKVSITTASLNKGNPIEKEITVVSGTNTFQMFYEAVASILTADLSHGNVTFGRKNGIYYMEYYDSQSALQHVEPIDPDAYYEVIQSNEAATINRIIVKNWGTETPLNLAIKNLNTNVNKAIEIKASEVNLELRGESTLTGTTDSGATCIDVYNSVLNIDGTGILNVSTQAAGPGIGPSGRKVEGTIVINGGTINASTSSNAAAIGGPTYEGTKVTIIINGGTITGTASGTWGAVIGGGSSSVADITIKGGNIDAKTTNSEGMAPAIGGYAGSSITIDGGTIIAQTSGEGAAIGSMSNQASDIEINGGNIVAKTSYYGAAIGGGSSSYGSSNIVINGGKIYTENSGNDQLTGAGIGGGEKSGATITINGGYIEAIADSKSAAIGGGLAAEQKVNITITGGTISAQNTAGTKLGDSIGGGKNWGNRYPSEVTLVITGGNVCSNKTYGTVTNGETNNHSVSLTTLTLDTVSEDLKVTEISAIPSYYGLEDVQTIDGKLYLYLPKDPSIVLNREGSSVTANEQVYQYNENSGKYANHIHEWVNGVCTVCSGACSHTGGMATCTEQAVCAICGMSYGELADHTGGTATCKELAKCEHCGASYGELADHTGGTATCKEKANCEHCGASYGEFDPNNHEYEKNNGICCDTYQSAVDSNSDGYYEIGNAGQLFWFANYINTVDRTASAVLVADIDLEGRPWTPIGSTGESSNNFRGVFDGQNHTIKGLYVEGGRAGLGFFGEVRTGTVKNFTIYGVVVANTDVNYVGGVIGSACGLNGDNDLKRNGAVIQNITSYVNLTAKAHGVGMIGGFVGYANHESLIENCSWYGTFDAGIYRVDSGAGGFIGKIQENTSEVTICNCGAYGTIKTNYAKNSYNNTATIYMGGFLSFSNTGANTVLENCLFAGKFERGANLTDEAFLGAFGTLRSVKAIKNCYYLGDDGLEAVHSDSPLTPESENVEITSVTGEQLLSGEVAYKLGEAFGQTLAGENRQSYPVLGGAKVYQVTNCKGETAYSNTEENSTHTEKTVTGKAPTCTEPGLTDGVICSVCGETLTVQEEIPAGHKLTQVEAQAPTCIEAGWDAYEYCTECDYSTKVEIPATGNHVDADNSGRCDLCNCLMQPAKLRFASVSLKGSIAINYYMLLSDELLHDSTAYMQFTMADGEIVQIPVSEGVATDFNGETYYKFTCAVAAKEMTDIVLSQFFYEGGSTTEFSYTVKTYADYIIANSSNANEVALAKAMLNYGAASQIHFGYNTDKLANAGLEVPDYSDVTISGFNATPGQGTELAKFYSASLILKSETTLRFFFTGSITATYKGQALDVKERNGLYYVDVVGIAAKDLDEDVTITINDGTNTADVTYNPMAYCTVVQNDTTGVADQAMKDLVTALYLYNQAANASFGDPRGKAGNEAGS